MRKGEGGVIQAANIGGRTLQCHPSLFRAGTARRILPERKPDAPMEFRSVSAGGYDRRVSGERCEAESGGGWAEVTGHGFVRNDRALPDPGSRAMQRERTHRYGCKIGTADSSRAVLSDS